MGAVSKYRERGQYGKKEIRRRPREHDKVILIWSKNAARF